ncbi:transposon tf2-9 polyprotein [Plakobranchus ocellatus]|uniref:Transposon tf2-9 polyprotein n=1 Tax=Plakobranchus ocellatus TaxID=259542 RepID=A0AAV4BPG0_9GAST|nr:transposon tf2-9 polyprotein [Plakobranchus ocellatus]
MRCSSSPWASSPPIPSHPDRSVCDIHVDLIDPLLSSQGCSYMLTVVDRFTRWPGALLLLNPEAITWTLIVLQDMVFQTQSLLIKVNDLPEDSAHCELHKVLDILERFHSSLKAAFRASLSGFL